ncbi:MAG: hypothetical protein HYS81_05490 [Candidatus Aenigmatarchaeota archaeon]|nr:MAG: hypothetical protein HYS81_05490 [Candidatus Aenigmarchaeota archaeon]
MEATQLFERALDIAKEHNIDERKYGEGKRCLDELDAVSKSGAEEAGLDWERVGQQAAMMRKSERGGDILRVLDYLSGFTRENDPRINGARIKEDYMIGVRWFIAVAGEYMDSHAGVDPLLGTGR